MRRRQRRVPDTAQCSLGWDGVPGAEGAAAPTKKIRCGGMAFRESTPWHLYVGNERLDQYLNSRGMGWVVRLREELQAVDFSDLEANYTWMGRAPYPPRMMMGLIIYGMLKRKSTLRELEELAVADVGAWWLCGGEQPDHSTIGNFLVRHQQAISRELFISLVRDLVGRKGITNGVVAGWTRIFSPSLVNGVLALAIPWTPSSMHPPPSFHPRLPPPARPVHRITARDILPAGGPRW